MRYLSATLRKQLGEIFRELPRPVTLLVFTGANSEGAPCETCDGARDLIQELASISDGRVRAELYDVEKDSAMASIYSIDKTPAIVVLGDESSRRDFGIRFFGAPAGYEFATLIEDIRMASTGETELRKETVDVLTHLTAPIHLQVFVTPSCPYCPRAVLLAHKLAMVSDLVTADAVDATVFPDLADEHHVYGVPRTIANGTIDIEGAVPEATLMTELLPLTTP